MAIRSLLTHTGTIESDEDARWRAYCDWNDLYALFHNPQEWATSLKDDDGQPLGAALAEGTILFNLLYSLDKEGEQTSHSLVVDAGVYSDIVNIHAITTQGMPTDILDLKEWIPQGGGTLFVSDAQQETLPEGSVVELADGTTIRIPITGELVGVARPHDNLGYLHFPVKTTNIDRFIADIAQNPQRLVAGIKQYLAAGGKHSFRLEVGGKDSKAEIDIQFTDLDATNLKGTFLQFKSGPPTYTFCAKGSGHLVHKGGDCYELTLSELIAYVYR